VPLIGPFTSRSRTPNNDETIDLYRLAMANPAPASEVDARSNPLGPPSLGAQERAVLSALVANRGRVVSRVELSRQAGLADLSERRCDSILVGLRRRLGPDAIRTVRSRGWMLEDHAAEHATGLLRG
jgi:DNA-binding response OmpR family regulator